MKDTTQERYGIQKLMKQWEGEDQQEERETEVQKLVKMGIDWWNVKTTTNSSLRSHTSKPNCIRGMD